MLLPVSRSDGQVVHDVQLPPQEPEVGAEERLVLGKSCLHDTLHLFLIIVRAAEFCHLADAARVYAI